MGFAHLYIEPDENRPKFFDGNEGDPSAIAEVWCIACNDDVHVPLWQFLDRHLSWQHKLPPHHVSQLATLFRLKSESTMGIRAYVGHGSRFPVIGICECDVCGHQLTVCISYDELSPLRYEAVIDGVAEWAPD